jgi:hypothetical protein
MTVWRGLTARLKSGPPISESVLRREECPTLAKSTNRKGRPPRERQLKIGQPHLKVRHPRKFCNFAYLRRLCWVGATHWSDISVDFKQGLVAMLPKARNALMHRPQVLV